METLYLDTHIVIWLREKSINKISNHAKSLIEKASILYVSPMVYLELQYLFEIGRLIEEPRNILSELDEMIDLKVDKIDLYELVKVAQNISWTRDAFDRLIVANTIYRNSALITKDNKILENFIKAVC